VGPGAQARAVRQVVPREIAPHYVYLASVDSSYMTAQAIAIDGGADN